MSNSGQGVIVGLSGGLGNQMFQYAAGRALSIRLGCSLALDLSWFLGRQDRHYALVPFNIAPSISINGGYLPSPVQSLLSRLSRRWGARRLGVPVFRESFFQFNSAFDELRQPVYMEGFWQSQRYFAGYREQLLKDFSLKETLPISCQQVLANIRSTQSICVHVRRGDYLSDPVAAKVHGICSVDYYTKGVTRLSQGLDNPHCFVFSDDPKWVREFLVLDYPTTVVDVNGSDAAHWDLYLMSSCERFLIANSSLSWWGAWLGLHKEKRVIAPVHWFLSSDKETRDLIPNSWERL